MTHNPESSVISDIDALIDESLAPGPVDDYSVNRYVRCSVCLYGDFHGLPDEDTGCPGEFGTEDQIETFRSRYSSHLPARPGAPWALGDLPTGTPIDPNFGYTLADIHRMQGGFGRGRLTMPRVRFWTTGEDGMLQEVEGTLQIGSIDCHQGQMGISGLLRQPVIQRLVPVSDVLGDVLEDADLTITAQTWIRGEEETQDAHPVGEIADGYITAEMAMAPGAGFERLGYIRPEEFEITTDVDYVETWGGRTLRSYETTTVSFTADMERGPAWEALFRH